MTGFNQLSDSMTTDLTHTNPAEKSANLFYTPNELLEVSRRNPFREPSNIHSELGDTIEAVTVIVFVTVSAAAAAALARSLSG